MARFVNPLHRPDFARRLRIADEDRAVESPSVRELRTQAVHRLQIGLVGLAGILLLIGLANAIMEHARKTVEVQQAAAAGRTVPAARPTSAPGDPLADMGVSPEMRATPGGSASTAGSMPR